MSEQQPTRRHGRMKVGLIPRMTEHTAHGIPSYGQLRGYAHQAEAAGFDSIWVCDHLLFRFPDLPTLGTWEAWSIATALAETTERLEIGTLVMCTAFRHPALLAKMAATLDEISGGRLILGVGAGWHQPEFDAFGLESDHKVARFAEAIQILVALLREGQVDFVGQYYRATQCELRPRGPRPSGIPLLIGAGGPRMLELTARYADSWNTCWLGQPTLLSERRDTLNRICYEQGRDPATLATTVGVNVAYTPPGATPATPPDPTQVLSGTTAEVAAGLRAYEAAGVAHLICSLDPLTDDALAWLSEVLAAFRDM